MSQNLDLRKLQTLLDEANPFLVECLQTKTDEEISLMIESKEKQKQCLEKRKNEMLIKAIEEDKHICQCFLLMRSILREMRGSTETNDNSYIIG